MHTNLKKLATTGAAAIALAAPALLIVGAGTAQAAATVSYTNNAFGTIAHIADASNPAGAIEVCTYSSHVAGNPLLFPYFSTVQLSGPTASDLQIFGIQTGTKYDVTVTCPVGGTKTFQQNF